jgi:hypothetical protein
MTPAERDRMNLLSMLIQCERSHVAYLNHVREITELMAQKERRLAEAERIATAGTDGDKKTV